MYATSVQHAQVGLEVLITEPVVVSNTSLDHLAKQALHVYQSRNRSEHAFLFFTQFPDFTASHSVCDKVALVNFNASQTADQQAWSLASDVVHAIGHALGLQDDEDSGCMLNLLGS